MYKPNRHELYTQLAAHTTAPKWSFNSRHHTDAPLTEGQGLHAPVDTHRDTHAKYDRQPKCVFHPPHNPLRPTSAPGPGRYGQSDYCKPRPPAYGFGSSRRGSPESCGLDTDSPGPGVYAPKLQASQAYMHLMTPRRDPPSRSSTPGPSTYRPREASGSSAPRWKDSSGRRPHSAAARCDGSLAGPGTFGGGPKYSVGARRNEEPQGTRRLGGPYTNFGY